MAEPELEVRTLKRKKAVRNAGVIFIITVILLTFFSSTINNFLMPEVLCKKPFTGQLVKEIGVEGRVYPQNPERIYSLGSWRITDVRVKTGYTVYAGDVLASVDADDVLLDIKKMELDLLRMENDLEDFREAFQSVELPSYRNSENEATMSLKKAIKEAAEKEDLYKSGAVPLDELDDAKDRMEKAERYLTAAQSLLKQKESEYKRALAEKASEIDVYKLDIANSRKKLPADGIIKAPVDGVINTASIEKGSVTGSGQMLFEIVRADGGLLVKWLLDARAASEVEEKDEVNFTLSLPEKFLFKGIVKEKSYLAEEGMYEYVSEITDGPEELAVGQKVAVSVKKQSQRYPLVVKNSSVIQEAGETCIYILETKSTAMGEGQYARRVPVKVLEADDFNSAISTGEISDQSQVVYFSTKALSDNAQVKLR